MSEGDSTWSLGVLIGLPLLSAVVILLLIGAALAKRWARKQPDHSYDARPVLWIGRGLQATAVIVVVVAAWGYYPFKAEYHQYVTKVGTVDRISSRLLGSSDSFQQKFVARYTDGRQFGCEDTRCANVRKGDRLTMACKRAWQYAGEDGYDCKFIRNEPTEGTQ